ncbi:RimK family protein [Oceanobacter kriegii]|uniref:RimK family protein n=1 Tax=Oceanobacter kriegii TaxID=64972 RepID=UPI00040C7804|nr:RimK family protein [Oceanobacter kriegii]
MPAFYVVVDDLNDWAPYYPSQDVITFEQYLALESDVSDQKVRVLNCCRNSTALGKGYYCSLLAEARGHSVIPSITVFNDVRRKSLLALQLEGLDQALDAELEATDASSKQFNFQVFFGSVAGHQDHGALAKLGRQLFERFPAPVLDVTMRRGNLAGSGWKVDKLKVLALPDIGEDQQTLFANALEDYSTQIWRKPKTRKRYRYDLAILLDPNEALPPSDSEAITHFIQAGNTLGINVELISKKDYMRLAEYDGLFIRATTAIDHHTYRFAKKAEAEGLVVMDDPTSILRCTNKVYLADLLKNHQIGTPNTLIVSKVSDAVMDQLEQALGYPMVLKTPDGSFSRGVTKAKDRKELAQGLKTLKQKSALVLVQEYLYTDFDWRIGVLNNKPVFACRYFMVKDHWQIYQHDQQQVDSGDFDTLPVWDVPTPVLNAALQATRLIGDGFYGVDLKQVDDRVVVIEVNDNPSVDAGVEDQTTGPALYHDIMAEFLRRMENQHQGA